MLPGKRYTPDDYARIAWRRRWYIAIPAVVIASMTLVVSTFLPNRYRASTSILIIPQRVPTNFVRPTVTADLSERLNIISQQILSRTRLERIVQEFNLYPRERSRMIMEDVIERMRADINVNVPRQRSRRDDVTSFGVAFEASDARTAMRVTERLASLFVQENLEDRSLLADQTDQFLKGQLEDSRRRLIEQEKRLQAFRQQYSGRLPDQVSSNLQLLQGAQSRLQSLSESANRDRDRLFALEKTLSETSAVVAPSAPLMPNRRGSEAPSPGMTASQQLEVARAELRILELRLRPEHPDVGRAKRVIAELEAKAEAEALAQPLSAVTPAPVVVVDRAVAQRLDQIRTEAQEVRQRLESAKRETAQTQATIDDLTNRVQAGPGLQSQLSELMRDYSTLQESYTALLKKSEESKIAVNLERRQIGEQFKVIDGARLPEKPISPDRLRINLFGIIGGLALGLALVGFLEYRDTSFKTDDDVVTTLALPVLAVIPVMTSALERRSTRRRKLMLAASASVACMLLAAAVMLVWQVQTRRSLFPLIETAMYESFYGFRERPFDLTPNPRFLVMTDVHREALSNLEYGIATRTGITLLVGDAGTGKTTLIRTALERQPSRVHCVHLQNPALTRDEFVEMLAWRFELSDRARESKTLLLLELEAVLKRRAEAGESTVLLIDEAQSLPRDILEEVRLLANIETNEQKLLSVIMAGQPEVTALLNDESLRQLKQRIALRCELRPLTLQETAGYIAGRIRSAGGVGAQVFTREAVTLIHERSRGIPRTISVIADNALLTGFAVGQRPVNSTTVREVCRDFDLGQERARETPPADLPPAAQPPSPSGSLMVIDAPSPVAVPSEVETPAANPSDMSLSEAYEPASAEPKRRTFSFLRG